MPERLTAGLVTGCKPSESWRATRRGAALLAPKGLRTSMRPVEACSGTRRANRVGRLMSTWAGWPSTSTVGKTAGCPKPSGPRCTPVSSTSPRGRQAAGSIESMRGSGRISGTDWGWLRGMSNPDAQQGCYTQSIQPRCHIVEDNAPAFGQAFKLTDGKGLGDVEEAEENEGDQSVTPIEGAEEQGDPLSGNFVDD